MSSVNHQGFVLTSTKFISDIGIVEKREKKDGKKNYIELNKEAVT